MIKFIGRVNPNGKQNFSSGKMIFSLEKVETVDGKKTTSSVKLKLTPVDIGKTFEAENESELIKTGNFVTA